MTKEKCNKKGCNKIITVDHSIDLPFVTQVGYCKKHEAEL